MEGDLERLTAYTYLTVPDRAAYIAIMRVFTSTLLADLSAHDLAERLDDQYPVETVAAKLDALTTWGNLIPSSRPVKAGSIREYHRVRSRYQLSALGERIQRQADEILVNADAAREVSRELLALVARGLAELEESAGRPGGIDPREALDRVSTLFAQFGQFADSVRDFYAYLGQVIFRYDLDGAEFTGFKELLLDYAETITDEVALFAPQIEASIQGLWPRLPALLAGIDAADQGLAALQDADVRIQRSRGRELDDWAGLRAWFFDDTGQGSQVDQLRDATLRALQALLANAKRMIRSAGGGLSRRRDLIRLAQWFDGADDATAHDLFVAAFGLYGARHLGVAPDTDQDVPATTSWWDGPAARVPVALKERGSRAPRGRTAGPEDYADQRARLRERAEEDARRQRAAAAELRAAGPRLGDVRLSAPATRLFLDLLARSLAAAPPRFDDAETSDDDLDVRLRLIRTAGAATVVHGADGDLVLDGLRVDLGAAARPDLEAAG
ncbi:TIGR02677 family protein [Actinoallomurus sp. NPDC052308]|uniref:TIGR02677 family protein n=1 Tax=Actinoallomurus sp. NPDC052308 TaxID=3155530 RepID=UPI0034292A24